MDYYSFREQIKKKFQKQKGFSEEELDLLIGEVKGEFRRENKKTPVPLQLHRLVFSGTKKATEGVTPGPFHFDRSFEGGVNALLGANDTYKGSVFNIIRFLLTGQHSKIKKGVLNWLEDCRLEFSIQGTVYTTVILLPEPNEYLAGLYPCSLDELPSELGLVELPKGALWIGPGIENFQKHIIEFFFEELQFNPLSWVQNTPYAKSGSQTSGSTTWKTLFRSIYIDQDSYGYLLMDEKQKSQETLIFEMMLGFDLTEAINTLWVKLRAEQKRYSSRPRATKHNTSIRGDINERRQIVTKLYKDLEQLSEKAKQTGDRDSLIQRRNELQKQAEKATLEWDRLHKQYLKESHQKSKHEARARDLEQQISILDKRISEGKNELKRLKSATRFQVYLAEFEPAYCPHCQDPIKPERKKREQEHHNCMVCGEDVRGKLEPFNNHEEVHEKLDLLSSTITGQNMQLVSHRREKATVDNQLKLLEESLKICEAEKMGAHAQLNRFYKRASELSQTINSTAPSAIEQERAKLSSRIAGEEAIIGYLNTQLKDEDQERDMYYLRTQILEYAHSLLAQERERRSKSARKRFEKSLMEQFKMLGLKSITRVQVTTDCRLFLTQDGQRVTFNDMGPFERVRVKIVFLLTLMALEVNPGAGRHPRFLMLYNPAVGADERNKQRMAEMFHKIEEQFQDKIQILIASKDYEFKAVAPTHKVWSLLDTPKAFF